jgi:phosphotriesterase-related protein
MSDRQDSERKHSSSGNIQTVLGSIEPAALGPTLMHEHVPLLDWSELHETSMAPLKTVRENLLQRTVELLDRFDRSLPADQRPGAVVETTPIRVGRYPTLLRDLARRSKVHVIAATGFWCEALAPAHPWARELAAASDGPERMARLFIREIEEGMEDPGHGWGEVFTDIKAGIIKIGTSSLMQPIEHVVHRAAALASKETGCAITTHTNFGGGLEEARLLISEGVVPERVVIGHQGHLDDRNRGEANEYHEDIARLGCYVQFDRVGHDKYDVDGQARQIAHLFEAGYSDRVLVSHDRAPYHVPNFESPTKSEDSWEELPVDLTTVTTELLASLDRLGASRDEIQRILVANPRRVLAF